MTDDQSKRDKILDRVAAALKLAESEKKLNNREAAENATAIASRLMLQYGISQEAVDARNNGTDKIGKAVYVPGMFDDYEVRRETPWLDKLAGIVAHGFNCRVLLVHDVIKAKFGQNVYVFVGYEHEREQCTHYYSILQNALFEAVDKEYRKAFHAAYRRGEHHNMTGVNWRKNFIIGALEGIILKLNKIRENVIKEAPDQSTALVRINQALAKIDATLTGVPESDTKNILEPEQLNKDAVQAGYAWARNLELLTPIKQGEVKPNHTLPNR